MNYYHVWQFDEFLVSILEASALMVTGVDGQTAVELFTVVYLSRRHGKPVKFPLGRSPYSAALHVEGN